MWFAKITFNNDDDPLMICSDQRPKEWETMSSCQVVEGDFDLVKVPLENIASIHFYEKGPTAL